MNRTVAPSIGAPASRQLRVSVRAGGGFGAKPKQGSGKPAKKDGGSSSSEVGNAMALMKKGARVHDEIIKAEAKGQPLAAAGAAPPRPKGSSGLMGTGKPGEVGGASIRSSCAAFFVHMKPLFLASTMNGCSVSRLDLGWNTQCCMDMHGAKHVQASRCATTDNSWICCACMQGFIDVGIESIGQWFTEAGKDKKVRKKAVMAAGVRGGHRHRPCQSVG